MSRSPPIPSSSQMNLLPSSSTQSINSSRNTKLNYLLNNNLIKQPLAIVLNSTITVKSLCVCVFIGYLLSFKTSINQYMSVIPGKLLPPNFFLWTLISHSFIEYRLIELIADWFVILLYSKMLEPLWGTLECIQFYFLLTTLVAAATTITYFIAFAITFNESFLFDISIHGLGGLLGGFSVAIKQIMPDTILLNASFLRLKQDHLPLLLVIVATILYVIGLTDFTYLIMLTNGIFISWIYLRFFQKHKNGTRGDSSSTFVFASFFPSQIQPFVAIVANTIFNLLVKIKVCKQPPKRYNVSSTSSGSMSGSQSQITITLPLVNASIENADAERRRQKALKALKERLKKPDEEDVTNQWADRNLNDSSTNVQTQSKADLINETKSSASTSSSNNNANAGISSTIVSAGNDLVNPITNNSSERSNNNNDLV